MQTWQLFNVIGHPVTNLASLSYCKDTEPLYRSFMYSHIHKVYKMHHSDATLREFTKRLWQMFDWSTMIYSMESCGPWTANVGSYTNDSLVEIPWVSC